MSRARTSTIESLASDVGYVEGPSIKALAANHGIDFGIAIQQGYLGNSILANHIARESAVIVAESAMKFKQTEPTQGAFDYSGGDAIMAFADARGLKVRGHADIWHRLHPDWLAAAIASDWEGVMEDHIAAVAPRWDVVNRDVCLEVLAANGIDGSNPTGYREDSPWYIAAGSRLYIKRAYEFSRAYAPGVELSLCDFGVERNFTENAAKHVAVMDCIDYLAADGLIDSITVQGHIFVSDNVLNFSERVWKSRIQDYQSAGLKVHIGEFDVAEQSDRSVELLDHRVADITKRFLTPWLETCSGGEQLLVWGPRDDLSWRQGYPEGAPVTQRPLPWDANYNAKQMARALREIFA